MYKSPVDLSRIARLYHAHVLTPHAVLEMQDNWFRASFAPGTVRERRLEREPINHHRGIVVLENVPIGICDGCGAHYYAASVLNRAESILKAPTPNTRTIQVPVETY